MHCDARLEAGDIVTVHPAFGRHGKLVVTSALKWEVLHWNLSGMCESGEMVCIKPLPSGANVLLDRNWLTLDTKRIISVGPPLLDFDDDIPF